MAAEPVDVGKLPCETEWKEPIEEEGTQGMVYKALGPFQVNIPWFHGVCERNGRLKSPKDLGLGHSDASS